MIDTRIRKFREVDGRGWLACAAYVIDRTTLPLLAPRRDGKRSCSASAPAPYTRGQMEKG